MSRQRIATSLAAIGAAIVLVGAGLFVGGAANAAQDTIRTGGVISTVTVVEPAPFSYSYTNDWQTIATTTVYDKAVLLRIRWSVTSQCRGVATAQCNARILVNGTPAVPNNGSVDFTTYPDLGFRALSVEKVAVAPVAPATIALQVWPYGGDTVWDLAGWVLSIDALGKTS
jgi:hypothetical protein